MNPPNKKGGPPYNLGRWVTPGLHHPGILGGFPQKGFYKRGSPKRLIVNPPPPRGTRAPKKGVPPQKSVELILKKGNLLVKKSPGEFFKIWGPLTLSSKSFAQHRKGEGLGFNFPNGFLNLKSQC